MKPASGTAGATAVEFAVVISVMLALVFGIIDLGRLFLTQHALNYGVATAARYAVVNSTASTTTIQTQFTNAVTPAIGSTQAAAASVHVSFSPSEAVGNTVTISVTLAWKPASVLSDLIALTLSSSQTLTIVH